MKYTFYFILIFSFLSCQNDEKINESESQEKTSVSDGEATSPVNEDLATKGEVEIEDNLYKEYYANSKTIKFRGPQDNDGKRDGKWSYFSPDGLELSSTTYQNGKKHGESIVKYPSGAIFYTGEYHNDQQIGVWRTYTEEGIL